MIASMESRTFIIRRRRLRGPAYALLAAVLAAAAASCGSSGGSALSETTARRPAAGQAERARDICAKALIADSHIDYLEVRKEGEDLVSGSSGNFDASRAARGGLKVAFMPVYISAEDDGAGRAAAVAEARFAALQADIARHPDRLALAGTPGEARTAVKSGRLALVPALENCASLEGELSRIGSWRERGVAYMGLVHIKDNALCDSSNDAGRRWGGLSPLGRAAVAEMNRLGVMVDVSHASDEAIARILEVSTAPVIASHSGCRAFTPGFPRNLPDELIVRIAKRGGVIQIAFGSLFLSPAYERTMSDADLASAKDIALQIDHVARLAGVEHVGLGSDFDGVGYSLPREVPDASAYPVVVRELLALGYKESDIGLILGGNIMRVWEEVIDKGKAMRGE
jgi:membrane dipeptidase